MPYTPTAWVNNSAPGINATNLNKIETALDLVSNTFVVDPDSLSATVDSSGAIQAVIDAAAAVGGGRVVFHPNSPATVKSDTTLRVKEGVWFDGCGVLDLRGAADPQIALPASGSIPDRIYISNLYGVPTGVGIKLDTLPLSGGMQLGWPRYTVENVTYADAGSHAFWITLSSIIESRHINCVSVRSSGDGFRNEGTDNFFIGCTASEVNGSSNAGFRVGGGNNKYSCCKSYGNDGHGFEVVGAGRNMIAGCETQDNVGYGILVASHYNAISGLVSDTDLQGAVYLGADFNNVDCVVQYGGGGSGQVTKTGVFFDAGMIGNVVNMTIRPQIVVPVAGDASGNSVVVNGTLARRTLTYASTVTPDPYEAGTQVVTLTGNITVNAPTRKHKGQRLTLEFTQDGSGGRTVTFSGRWRTNWTPDTAAGKTNSITVEFDGATWMQVAATTNLTGLTLPADDFDRADGAIGTSSSGHAWSADGTWNIASNQAQRISGVYAVLDAGSGFTDFTAQVTVVDAGLAGMIWRFVDANNFYYCYGNEIGKKVAGSLSTITSGVLNIGAGDTITVFASGNNHIVSATGATSVTFVDTSLTAGTKVGMIVGDGSTPKFDNFSIT